MVLNVSEMEAKVRDATNDEPWWVSYGFESCSGVAHDVAQGGEFDVDAGNRSRVSELMSCLKSG